MWLYHIFVLGLIPFLIFQVAGVYVEALVGSVADAAGPLEPKIAMKCGFLNMHLNISNGDWIPDKSANSNCLTEKLDILEYCRKAYPTLQITNVVESTSTVRIHNWCHTGHKKCKWSHDVMPYRCLVGPFQSDPLLVPQHCTFDHIHLSEKCMLFADWQRRANRSCVSTGKTLENFGMLLPCGVDMFSGVEFVCCPREDGSEESADVVDADDTMEDDAYYSSDTSDQEHVDFKAAEKRLEEKHQAKVTLVMKKWSDMEEQYQGMKNSDPHGAEKFKKDMSSKFQKMVAGLEEEWSIEKLHLLDVHQQRVERRLTEKKAAAMTVYLNTLKKKHPQAHQIMKALHKYIRVEEKDRKHTISHYRHLVNTDPAAAAKLHSAAIEHMNEIDSRINQSIGLLQRLPAIERKIMPELRKFLNEIHSNVRLDDSNTIMKLSGGEANNEILEKYKEELAIAQSKIADKADREQEAMEAVTVSTGAPVVVEETTEEEPRSTSEAQMMSTAEQQAVPEIHLKVESVSNEVHQEQVKEAVDMAIADIHGDNLVAHRRNSEVEVEQNFIQESSVKQGDHLHDKGLFLAMTLGGTALLTAIIVGIVVAKKRVEASRAGFTEVDQQSSPEEKHVNNMQMNGYENPTYRYFESYTN
ncbi:PREDICTED: beta-amyloid-like protein [Priapulus caudatus]|uniref:Beta-amyloid-like protein n=1 Tax=Priapulus caudatus TaxID=37621 RepID=A0ABM1DTG4_PRICU|nr:PREDICTED: beta-amyloid-like protein [Priapulus caudatus]